MKRSGFAPACIAGAFLVSVLAILADAHFAVAFAQDISVTFGNGQDGGNGITERAVVLDRGRIVHEAASSELLADRPRLEQLLSVSASA